MISRQGFKDPSTGHRVCSKHFIGGRKTYLNNVPTIVPKTENSKQKKERSTVKARNRSSEPYACDETLKFDDTPVLLKQSEALPDDSVDLENTTNTANPEYLKILEILRKVPKLENECPNKNKEPNEKDVPQTDGKQRCSLLIDDMKHNAKAFRFYTGFSDYETFRILFDSFGPVVNNLLYHGSRSNPSKCFSPEYKKRGPKRCFSAEQELFLVLVRLRLGLLEQDIAFRAGISTSHFSRIWITWLDFLHSKVRSYPIWPSKATITKTMPSCFKKTYPTTRVIIDCTELYIEKPNSVRSQAATYSNYKHYNTAKGLVGITPAGAVSFVSDLFTGRTSDKEATSECGIYAFLENGDSLMADKGFNIKDDLPKNVSLNIPPFMRGKDHLSVEEETETRQIASVRIHVERAISRIKTFRIIKSVFPITMARELNQIWVICSYLTNFLPPLIVETDD